MDKNYIKNYPPESYYSLLFTNKKQVQAKSFFDQNFEDIKGIFRTNIYNTTNNPKDSILVFGCSFGYGSGLEDEDTFSNKIAKLTGRNIFNFAICACGTQHMYRIIFDDAILKEVSNTPSHAIYVYIPDHIRRINYSYSPNSITTTENNLNYKLNGNNLVVKTFPPFINKMFLFKKFITYIESKNKYSLEFKYNNFAIMNELLLNALKILVFNSDNPTLGKSFIS